MGLFRLEETRTRVRVVRVVYERRVQVFADFHGENASNVQSSRGLRTLFGREQKDPSNMRAIFPQFCITSERLSGIVPQSGNIKSFLMENTKKKILSAYFIFCTRMRERGKEGVDGNLST